MTIKFNTDDNIALNEIIYLPTITITIRSIQKKIINIINKSSYMTVCIKHKNARI